jgi:hypothetical protein
MSAIELYLEQDTERRRVERWRSEELERGGYSPDEAAQLAACNGVDLHLAIDLLQRGCPPELALQILL